MAEAYCNWYQKNLRDVAEHEQQQCQETKQECDKCPCLEFKENEA